MTIDLDAIKARAAVMPLPGNHELHNRQDYDDILDLIAEVERLTAWNGQAQIELDADHAEIGRLTAERDQWRRVAEYGWHLHNYGENAPGGTETWREFEQLIRAAADQGRPA